MNERAVEQKMNPITGQLIGSCSRRPCADVYFARYLVGGLQGEGFRDQIGRWVEVWSPIGYDFGYLSPSDLTLNHFAFTFAFDHAPTSPTICHMCDNSKIKNLHFFPLKYLQSWINAPRLATRV